MSPFCRYPIGHFCKSRILSLAVRTPPYVAEPKQTQKRHRLKSPSARGSSVRGIVSELFVSAEKKRNAPYSRDSYKNVNSPAEYARRAAKEPRDQIKLENTDQSPVYSSDYQKNKSYFVPHIEKHLFIRDFSDAFCV